MARRALSLTGTGWSRAAPGEILVQDDTVLPKHGLVAQRVHGDLGLDEPAWLLISAPERSAKKVRVQPEMR